MTEHDFQENAERYSEYRSLKQKLDFINGDIKGIEKDKIEKIQTDYGNSNIEKYSEEAKNGLKEYLKTMMLAEIERAKSEWRNSNVDIEKKISEALMRVAELDGVYPENEEIGIRGKYVNDYLLAFFLAQLLQSGDMKIKIRPDKIAYLRKLLKMEDEEKDAEL